MALLSRQKSTGHAVRHPFGNAAGTQPRQTRSTNNIIIDGSSMPYAYDKSSIERLDAIRPSTT